MVDEIEMRNIYINSTYHCESVTSVEVRFDEISEPFFAILHSFAVDYMWSKSIIRILKFHRDLEHEEKTFLSYPDATKSPSINHTRDKHVPMTQTKKYEPCNW
jgi:hypothetical protein